jgi:Nucleotidyl transferase AbiEii toxin, Type IV TA system
LARTHLPDGRLSEDIDLIAIDDRKAVAEVLDAQLLSARGRELWPTERRALQQRYHDAPAAELLVPTLPAFAASKTATWADRRAPRDLWDLWALTRIGAIDPAALQLYRRFGPTNQPPGHYLFEAPPSEAEWQSQLAGQTQLTVDAAGALATVRKAWARVVGSS